MSNGPCNRYPLSYLSLHPVFDILQNRPYSQPSSRSLLFCNYSRASAIPSLHLPLFLLFLVFLLGRFQMRMGGKVINHCSSLEVPRQAFLICCNSPPRVPVTLQRLSACCYEQVHFFEPLHAVKLSCSYSLGLLPFPIDYLRGGGGGAEDFAIVSSST